MAFLEFRLRTLHACIKRIEQNLTKHIDETRPILERFFKMEERAK